MTIGHYVARFASRHRGLVPVTTFYVAGIASYREPILDMQLVQERIADAAMDLFASTCVLSRWDAELQFARRNGDSASADDSAADLFLRQSFRRIRRFLGELNDNDDKALLATAKSFLGKPSS